MKQVVASFRSVTLAESRTRADLVDDLVKRFLGYRIQVFEPALVERLPPCNQFIERRDRSVCFLISGQLARRISLSVSVSLGSVSGVRPCYLFSSK